MSTFTSYLLLTRDYPRTLNNLGKTSLVSNAAQYYRANIGKVKSVDDLMKDNRLYNYAMKAAGLEDMAYAKAFMRKVLTSDLGDVDSFANKLTDKRYLDFAKMFNFGADGKVVAVTDIQSNLQEQEMVGLYNQQIIDKDKSANAKATAYSTAIDTITTVDGFMSLANRDHLKFALTAYGMGEEAKYVNVDFLKEVLTRGLDDPTNPLYALPATQIAYREKLSAFVEAFNFAPTGTVTAGNAQTMEQKSQTIAGYLNLSGEASEASALTFTGTTYRQVIGSVTSVDDLLQNSFLSNFVKTAYNLTDANDADIIAALQSDPSDPASAANQLGLNYKRLAEDFNFDASGNVPAGQTAQTAETIEKTVGRYFAHANSLVSTETSDSTTYRLTINSAGWIENIEDFLDVLGGVSPDETLPAKIITDEVAVATRNFIFKSFGFTGNETFSRDFLRDIFLSDLDDPASFANSQMVGIEKDKRWANMAGLFRFDRTTGDVLDGGPVQSAEAIKELSERYIGQGYGGVPLSQQARYSFQYEMQDVTNVTTFINSKSAFSFALVAFGLPGNSDAKETYRRALTDPAYAAATGDSRIIAFAEAFNFQSDGSLPPGGVQTILQRDDVIERFMAESMPGTGDYNMRSANEYAAAIADIRTVGQLLSETDNPPLSKNNTQFFNFVMSAFAIDMTKTTKAEIGQVLNSDLADPTSVANKMGGRFLELAQAFNFVAGIVPPGMQAQSDTQLTQTLHRFLKNNNPATVAEQTGATTTFKQRINALQSLADLSGRKAVDEFLNSDALYNYALIAYGLDPKTESKSKIRQALTADRSKPYGLIEPKYRVLADALNFDPDGSIGTPRVAQSTSDAATVAKKYAASYPADKRPAWAPDRPTAQENLIGTETDYYANTIQTISTVEQLTADKRMMAYISKAFGFEGNSLQASDLNKILTSDLADPKSYANTAKDMRYKEMAALFNFDKTGKTMRLPEQAVQSSGGIYQTYTSHLQQTLELQEGQSNGGVRLALYFARKAPTITSTFSILGDKALFEVVRTALGIPNEAARADIDVLARTIEKRLKVTDLKDPKKLESFIKRFTAMYDVQNGGGVSNSSNSLALIQGNSDTGFSQDMIQSLQSVRVRRF